MKQTLLKVDLFSQPVQLYIKKQPVHKTVFGALVSIVLMVSMGLYFILEVQGMTNRSNPYVISSEILQSEISYEVLNNRNFTFAFGLQNAITFQNWRNESLAQVQLWAVHKYTFLDKDGLLQVNFKRVEIPIIPCQAEKMGVTELKMYFAKFVQSTSYCIDYDNTPQLEMQGQFDLEQFKYLEVDVSNCKNDTENLNKPVCAPQEDIDNALKFAIFAWQISDVHVNVQNSKNPKSFIGKDFYTTITNVAYKHVDLYLQPVIIQTDLGYIGKDIQTQRGLKYKSLNERMDFIKLDDVFFQMMFRLDKNDQLIQSHFIKLTDILGNLGGLFNFLFIVLLFVVGKVNFLSQKLVIINSLFNFQGLETQKDKKQRVKINKSQKCENQENQSEQIIFLFNNRPQVEQIPQKIKNSIFKSNSIFKTKSISKQQQLNEYFKQRSTKILLSCYDYFQLIFSCFQMSPQNINLYKKQFRENKIKNGQIVFATTKVEQSLDIINVINKFNEIDKLKRLLLTSDQIELFDYIDKPTIAKDPIGRETDPTNNIDILSFLKERKKQSYKEFLKAQQAYNNLLTSNLVINVTLVSMLNVDVRKLFQVQLNQDRDLESLVDEVILAQNKQEQESECEYCENDDERKDQKEKVEVRPYENNQYLIVESSNRNLKNELKQQ